MGFSEEGQGLWQPNTHGFVFVTKLLVMLVPDCNQIHSPALKKKKKKHRLAQVRTKKWTWAHIFRGIYLTYSKTLTQLRPNLRNICFSDCQVCPPWKKERKKKKKPFSASHHVHKQLQPEKKINIWPMTNLTPSICLQCEYPTALHISSLPNLFSHRTYQRGRRDGCFTPLDSTSK